MKYLPTPLKGVYLIDLEKKEDERGFFARAFCKEEFTQQGLEGNFIQMNNSFSPHKGTLRGLHYQLPPKAEIKLVRCVRGSFYDVVLDLRLNSVTFGKAFGKTLSADNRLMMYVPKGCAHGFLTLEEDSEVLYLNTEVYSKELERGIRWNDPRFAISWPFEPVVISDKDRNHPNFNPAYHLNELTAVKSL
jgi:dTDP-4-dehydrorhamnose 3,5-epimerase